MSLTVTVVIPTIAGRDHLRGLALRSVERQTRPADEIIVSHDTERTGAARTRNCALMEVTTDLVAWLDDDDELLPRHLEVLVGAFENDSEIDLAYPIPHMGGGAQDPTAVPVNGRLIRPWGIPFGPEQENHLKTSANFIPVTHVVRADLARKVGGFPIPNVDPDWPDEANEDWGMLLRLLKAGAKFVHVPEKTWIWNVHSGQTRGKGIL